MTELWAGVLPTQHCKGAVKRRTLLIRYVVKRDAPQRAQEIPILNP